MEGVNDIDTMEDMIMFDNGRYRFIVVSEKTYIGKYAPFMMKKWRCKNLRLFKALWHSGN